MSRSRQPRQSRDPELVHIEEWLRRKRGEAMRELENLDKALALIAPPDTQAAVERARIFIAERESAEPDRIANHVCGTPGDPCTRVPYPVTPEDT